MHGHLTALLQGTLCTIKLSIDDSLVPESMALGLAFHNEDAPLADWPIVSFMAL